MPKRYLNSGQLYEEVAVSSSGVDGLTTRLSNMRQFVQQQITTLTAKQARTLQYLPDLNHATLTSIHHIVLHNMRPCICVPCTTGLRS